jgi:hypothetical protein
MDYDQAPEIEIENLAEEIFSKPIKPARSIQLFIEQDMETLFFILLQLLKKGIQIVFNNKNIFELSQEEFQKLQQYFNSFGFQIGLDIKNYGESRPERTDVNDLSQFNLNLHNNVISYNIYFDFLNH